jgi:hypothetical protein
LVIEHSIDTIVCRYAKLRRDNERTVTGTSSKEVAWARGNVATTFRIMTHSESADDLRADYIAVPIRLIQTPSRSARVALTEKKVNRVVESWRAIE